MFVFLCVCLNFQCLVKILGCFTFGSSTSEHSAVLGLRELFPSPFNRGFQLSSLEEFSQAPCHPFFFFPFLSFFLSFFPFGLFHVDILTLQHIILSKYIYICTCQCVFIIPSFLSSVQSIVSDPMNHSIPGLPIHHQFLEFTQTHVHRVSDAIQPCHPLLSPSPPAPNPSPHQSLFQWVNSSQKVAKVLKFQL